MLNSTVTVGFGCTGPAPRGVSSLPKVDRPVPSVRIPLADGTSQSWTFKGV